MAKEVCMKNQFFADTSSICYKWILLKNVSVMHGCFTCFPPPRCDCQRLMGLFYSLLVQVWHIIASSPRKKKRGVVSGVDFELRNNLTRLQPCGSPIGDVRPRNCGVMLILNVLKIWKHKGVFDDHCNPDNSNSDWPAAKSANKWQMLHYLVPFHERPKDHKRKFKNVLWNERIKNAKNI